MSLAGSLFEKSQPGTKLHPIRIVNAAANDDVYALFQAPYDCRLVGVYAQLDDAVATHATDYVTVTIQDGGADGTGTTTIDDAWTNNSGGAGDTATQFVAATIVEPSTPYDLSAGDVVKANIVNAAAGTALTGLWWVAFDGG